MISASIARSGSSMRGAQDAGASFSGSKSPEVNSKARRFIRFWNLLVTGSAILEIISALTFSVTM